MTSTEPTEGNIKGTGQKPMEQCFTITEVSGMLKTSPEKMRLMIKDEPGVLRILPEPRAEGYGRKKRPKVMYRIPASVIERLVRRLSNPPAVRQRA